MPSSIAGHGRSMQMRTWLSGARPGPAMLPAWPPGPDDPVVALLRALARLSIIAPDAESTHAAMLIARYDPTGEASEDKR